MNNPLLALDAWSIPSLEYTKLEQKWEYFVTGEYADADVRPLVAQSWQRCLEHGIDPFNNKTPVILPEDRTKEVFTNHSLYAIIHPYLQKLQDFAVDSGHMVVFCNANGHILHIYGDRSLRKKAENMNFVPGSTWAEEHAGTNAIGTALSAKKSVQIFAAEHFSQKVHPWTCSAALIRDPATQQILGVIDLTGLKESYQTHSLPVVVTAAQAIEDQLRYQLEVERYKLLEHYMEFSAQKNHPMMAAFDRGGNIVKASSSFYEEGLTQLQHRLSEHAFESSWDCETQQLELKGRTKKWQVSVKQIHHAAQPIGTIMFAEPVFRRKNVRQVSQLATTKYTFYNMVGRSSVFQNILSEARTIAQNDYPVLIYGESGTGKELLAQSIHASSPRQAGPFVAVNCGAIPRELAVSEFFGYEAGAFTHASKDGRIGKFELANEGTLFLDEIGEMPLDLQAMLLRVLEEGEVVRLGGNQPISVNVRIVVATNRDLLKEAESGNFRHDLYYRLSVLSLRMPPLRERKEDIQILARFFLDQACNALKHPPLDISSEVLAYLAHYHWPGNIRELKNTMIRLATRVAGTGKSTIGTDDLPEELYLHPLDSRTPQMKTVEPDNIPSLAGKSVPYPEEKPGMDQATSRIGIPHPLKLKDQELNLIQSVLHECEGNVSEASRKLGVSRSTIYRKLKAM